MGRRLTTGLSLSHPPPPLTPTHKPPLPLELRAQFSTRNRRGRGKACSLTQCVSCWWERVKEDRDGQPMTLASVSPVIPVCARHDSPTHLTPPSLLLHPPRVTEKQTVRWRRERRAALHVRRSSLQTPECHCLGLRLASLPPTHAPTLRQTYTHTRTGCQRARAAKSPSLPPWRSTQHSVIPSPAPKPHNTAQANTHIHGTSLAKPYCRCQPSCPRALCPRIPLGRRPL